MQGAVWNVSTHSRLKAADNFEYRDADPVNVSTHSRLKAAEARRCRAARKHRVSTHSRLKAAEHSTSAPTARAKFQHTAA